MPLSTVKTRSDNSLRAGGGALMIAIRRAISESGQDGCDQPAKIAKGEQDHLAAAPALSVAPASLSGAAGRYGKG